MIYDFQRPTTIMQLAIYALQNVLIFGAVQSISLPEELIQSFNIENVVIFKISRNVSDLSLSSISFSRIYGKWRHISDVTLLECSFN